MTDEKETGRIEAFSDGVFAVAITLLVLDIKVPTTPLSNPQVSLTRELFNQWPVYLAFVTSFLTILVMWINHHRIFGLIKRSDDRFLIINGLLLLTVSVFPFTTSLVATYIRNPQVRDAALVYSGTSVLLAVMFNVVWRYASKDGRLLAANHDTVAALGITESYRHGPTFYIIVFLIGFFSPHICLLLCLALALFFTIPPRKHAACATGASSRNAR